jgi:hypothetical protein
MKHKMNRRVALAFAVCVACVLAFGAALAQADVNSGLSGTNMLTVSVADPDTDIKNADVKVNVYRVATGSKNASYDSYNYAFDVPAFKELGEGYDPATMSDDSWQRLAEAAGKIVDDGGLVPNATAPAGETIAHLPDGIYLVVIPEAQSESNSFTFAPTLVALPGKVGADGSPVYNTSGGRWTNTDPEVAVPVVAKWTMAPRYGSLQINKVVPGFSGEAATFVYSIVDAKTGGEQYSNYAAVQYGADGVQSTAVGHIPAGMKVIVTEEYTGARFELASDASQTATIVADETVEVDFQNTPDGSGTQGHGIENHFVFDEEYNGGDWHLDVRAIDASEVVSE